VILFAAGSSKALWYATRGTGVVALLLLTATVVLGILSSSRWTAPRLPRFVVGGLHRNLSLLSVAFVAVHVVTAVVDHFAPIGLKDAVVPFASPYRPVWLGLGAVSFDLLLAVLITSLVRARLGVRVWRTVHWLAYASWPVALGHSLGTGTDAKYTWMALLALASVGAVVAAILFRLGRNAWTPGARALAGVATLAVSVVVFAWYEHGPARRGWASRAGTPASLLHRGAVLQTAAGSPISAALPASHFSGDISGRLTQAGPDSAGMVRVNILAALHGHVAGNLRITLWGVPTEGGGVALASSDVAFGADGTTQPYVGRVTGLLGDHVDASLADAQGKHLRLSVDLRLDRSTGAVTGRLDGRAS
jgi:methionine sulfoxide reductase heme-binding subunit